MEDWPTFHLIAFDSPRDTHDLGSIPVSDLLKSYVRR